MDDVVDFKHRRYCISTRNQRHSSSVASGNQKNNFNNPVTSPPFFLLATSSLEPKHKQALPPRATSHSTSATAESLFTQVNKSWQTFFGHTNLSRNCSTVEYCVWSTKKGETFSLSNQRQQIKWQLELKSSLFLCQKGCACRHQVEFFFISLDTFKTAVFNDTTISIIVKQWDKKNPTVASKTIVNWQLASVFSFYLRTQNDLLANI